MRGSRGVVGDERTTLIVFHRPEQSVEIRSLSPSAGKPARLMTDWRERFPSLDVRGFEPLDTRELERVHDGDDTRDIIEWLGLGATVTQWCLGEHDPRRRAALLPELRAAVERIDADVVLYQAGADAHEDDPLGGWLTTEEMVERDRIVFETLARKGIPVAWNLAGGYQEPIERVLGLHSDTMRVALEVERGHGGIGPSSGGV